MTIATTWGRFNRMHIPITVILASLLMLSMTLAPVAARAQNAKGPDDLKITIAPYAMVPWMDGNVGARGFEVDVNMAPRDVFDNLQFSVMGYFEARKGKWAAGVDALYMGLGTTVERVPVVGERANADVDVDQGAYTFTGLRALNENVDFVFGARWNVLQNRIGFKGPEELTVKERKDWVDPIVGLKLKHKLAGPLNFSMQADIGGFGVGSDFAWQLFPVVGMDVGTRTTLGIGYRVLGMDYQTGDSATRFKYDVITQALVLGAAFHF